MRKFWGYLWVAVMVVSLSSCKKKIPSSVIQPGELENILYDYHLAQAMGEEFEGNERYKRELLVQYVFKKHHVTQAEFDSSMVWYTRNMEKLNDVYKSLNQRFETAKIESLAQNFGTGKKTLPSGDSINIWPGRSLHLLTASDLVNRITFEIPTDTTFHELDRLVWHLHSLALSPDSLGVFAGLTVYYTNDSTRSMICQLPTDTLFTLELNVDTLPMRYVRGFIYLNDTIVCDTVPSVVISDIALMRYHASSQALDSLKQLRALKDTTAVERKDSVKTKKLKALPQADTLKQVNKRLSPAELRRRQSK